MAGPIQTFVQLPDDGGNTGKKMQTVSRVVGGQPVHAHYYTPIRAAVVLGVYRYVLPQAVCSASATNGTSTGHLWFHVPLAISGKKARIRRISVSTQSSTAFAGVSSPRVAFARYTFTGTASGAAVTPAKTDATAPPAVADLRTAVTGLTVSLAGLMGVAPYVGALTAVGAYAPSHTEVMPPSADEDQWWVIAPGEGVVVYQDVAGTAADTRQMNLFLLWDEIDVS